MSLSERLWLLLSEEFFPALECDRLGVSSLALSFRLVVTILSFRRVSPSKSKRFSTTTGYPKRTEPSVSRDDQAGLWETGLPKPKPGPARLTRAPANINLLEVIERSLIQF